MNIELLSEIGDLWAMNLQGVSLLDKEAAPPRGRVPKVSGGIAVLPLSGVLSPKGGWYGTSTKIFGEVFSAAMETKEIGAVVFDVDSPGGISYEVPELSDRIHAARGSKPIIAVANHTAASAALWAWSAADTRIVAPSGEVGSIGVWSLHLDYSQLLEQEGIKATFVSAGKYKVEGNPYEPLGDEARAEIQRGVDEVYSDFVSHVARNVGVTKSQVEKDFGQGRMLSAKRAVEVGLADGVDTLDGVLSRIRSRSGGSRRADADLTEHLLQAAGVESPQPTVEEMRLRRKNRQRATTR